MYAKGEVVPKDFVLAHMWINLAASRATCDERQSRVKARDLIEKRMTRKQINKAQRLAREWKPKGSGSQ